MEPITFLISINRRPDGRFDAFCENMPETVVSGNSHEEAADSAINAMREHIATLVERDATPDESELEFLEDAFQISQKHRGDPGEWLPMIFDEEGVHLGEPIGTPKVVTIQFATSSGSISDRPSEPAVRELRSVAV